MNRKIVLSAAVIVIVLVGLIVVISYTGSGGNGKEQKPFYVGVTYGGNSVEDAKVLIDKVKNYTNLFVIASGHLQYNYDNKTLGDICDYAVDAGLDVIFYSGSYEKLAPTTMSFIASAQERWGSHFLGVYFGDEPGGIMLDNDNDPPVYLGDFPNIGNVTRYNDYILIRQIDRQANYTIETIKSFFHSGNVYLEDSNSTLTDSSYNATSYSPDGTVTVTSAYSLNSGAYTYREEVNYFKNGTVTLLIQNSDSSNSPSPVPVTDRGNISQFTPYQENWNSRPFQTANESAAVATAYANALQTAANNVRNQSDLKLFTSDYALYWYDYKGGYDTVLAQLGWNNTIAQEIGLTRGAANLQGKSWGTILTWKYTHAPYLADGDELFEQMKTSYEAGAEYVLVFNYAEDMTGPYGTLQEQHFRALERFWNEVAQNPDVVHGGIKAEAALVLPENYGWGMRNADDSIWGFWRPDGTSEQIWHQLQSKLEQYGTKLDIVYEDPAFPVEGKYGSVFYWDTPNP
jgi:hypothetical protein